MKRIGFLAIFLVLFFAAPLWAATYTVCSSGCDYSTIQACENGVSRGDICSVQAGTYNERPTVDIAASGSTRVTFICASGTCAVEGFIVNVDYITIDNFTVTNSSSGPWQGVVWVNDDASYIEIQNNLFDGVTTVRSIGVWDDPDTASTNVVIDNNVFTDSEAGIIYLNGGSNHFITNNEFYSPNTNGNMDTIRLNSDSTLISGNYQHSWAYKAGTHVDFIQSTIATSGNVVEHNRIDYSDISCSASGDSIAMIMLEGGTGPTDWIVRYNTLITNTSGIIATGGNGHKIYSNTFVGDGILTGGCKDSAISLDGVSNVSIENNITVDFDRYHINFGGGSTGTADYNLKYDSDAGNPGGQGQQANDVWKEDPLFVNAASDDYTLQSTSPAINAGNPRSGSGNYDDGLDPSDNGPSSGWLNPNTLDQDDYGSDWEMGAYVYKSGGAGLLPPTGLVIKE